MLRALGERVSNLVGKSALLADARLFGVNPPICSESKPAAATDDRNASPQHHSLTQNLRA
jgi:hypothetical protein